MNSKLLDEINRKLILFLEEDPDVTDADLARKLKFGAIDGCSEAREAVGGGDHRA